MAGLKRTVVEMVSGTSELTRSAAEGARGIFVRFLLVAVGLNALVGVGVVTYDVADSIWVTRDSLRARGELLVSVAKHLRKNSSEPDETVVQRASSLTGAPMALVSLQGDLEYATRPDIASTLPQIYEGRLTQGTAIASGDELGELSGAWIVNHFSPEHDLLVVVHRRPAEEGLMVYMTIAAGLSGLGVGVSFIIMLAAANWMLRRPLSRLIGQLTGALAEQLSFRNNLIDASEAVGIVAADSQGQVQIFNRAAERILGYSAQEVQGCMRLDDVRREVRGTPTDSGLSSVHRGEGEVFWLDRQGRELLLSANDSEITDDKGQSRGRLITFIDVTERRRLEAELRLNELKLIQSAKMATLGEMATGIAHELNQPLNNVGLLASRISMRLHKLTLNDEERGFFQDKLEKLRGQVERASKIIDHLRTFGRPTRKHLSPVAVREPIEAVVDLLREQFAHHDIEIEIDVPEQTPQVVADASRLEQVLMNLLINARDALVELTPSDNRRKKIRVDAASETSDEGTAVLRVRVLDNGPGMTPEVQQRIFDPFFSTKEVGKGTGLGLSISYGLVRDFGGSLEVQSEPGQGSAFSVLLALAKQPSRSSSEHPTEAL